MSPCESSANAIPFLLNQDELKSYGVQRIKVDTNPGYPCRVSLQDAEVGEDVILINFIHHQVDSPYKSSSPIFIRENTRTAKPKTNEVPIMLQRRFLSVRAYDEKSMMVGAKVVEGQEFEQSLRGFFAQDKVSYLHIHNAIPGCYNCKVERA